MVQRATKTAPNSPNTMSGHGTVVVRRMATLGGEIVDKTMKSDGAFQYEPDKWMKTNIHARDIANQIHEKNNPAYNVPRTFISHGRVREQFAPGRPLRDLPQKYLRKNGDALIFAAANFINDMSELYPMRTDMPPAQSVRHIGIKNIEALNKILDAAAPVLNTKNSKLISDIFIFLRDLPENSKYLFAHNDLHGKNILVEEETGRMSIIDFELAGYTSMFDAMYSVSNMHTKQLWDTVNKLPRTVNPNLHWEFDPDKAKLMKFIQITMATLRKFIRHADQYTQSEIDNIKLSIAIEGIEAHSTFEHVKAKTTKAPMEIPIVALVTKNHYRR